MVAKKTDMPDIGGLLSKISEKRDSGELPRTEIQRVQPVQDKSRIDVKPVKRTNVKTLKHTTAEGRSAGGRPTVKQEGIEYVKLSPRIPKALSTQAKIALAEERFQDKDGQPVKTLDELVALALESLFR
jgi:hypothetical protein